MEHSAGVRNSISSLSREEVCDFLGYALASLPHAFYLLSVPDFRFTYLNSQKIEFLAHAGVKDPESALGLHPWDYFPHLRDVLEPACEEAYTTGEMRELPGLAIQFHERVLYWDMLLIPVVDTESEEVVAISALCYEVTERERLAETLRQYETLFRRARDIVMIMSRDGRILEANDAAVETYGYSRDELLSMSIHDIRDPSTSPVIEEQMGHADMQGILFETVHHRKDGSSIPVEVSSQGITIRGERLLFSVIRDITERKEAEEELRQSWELLYAIIDNTAAAIYVKDLEGRLLLVNQALADLMDYDKKEMIGKTSYDLYPREIAEDHTVNDRQVIESGKPYEAEEIVPGDGSVLTFLSAKYPLRDSEGNIYGVAGISTEITEQKQAEAQIRRIADQVSLLLESTDQGIYEIDLDGNCTLINSAAVEMLAWSREELIGKNMHDLIHHTQADGSPYPFEECPIYEALHTGEGHRVMNEVFWRRDGTPFPVEYSSYPTFEDGEITGAVVAFFDISERKRAEEALRESEERFRAAVAGLLDPFAVGVPVYDEGRIVDISVEYANQPALQFLGVTAEEFIGKRLLEVLPLIRDLGLFAMFVRVIETGQALTLDAIPFEFTVKGERPGRTVDLTMNRVQDHRVVVSWRNITERKKAEEALADQRELLQTIIDNIPVYLVLWDGQLQEFRFNKSFQRDMGWTEEDAAEGDLMAKVYPDTEYRQEVAEFMASLQPGFRDIKTTAKDGRQVDIAWANVHLSGDRSIGIGVNVEERKQAEEALEAERARLRAIIDSIPMGVFIADADGRVVETNDAAKKVWGGDIYLAEGIEDYAEYKGWNPDSGEQLRAQDWSMARALTKGEVVVGDEIYIQRFDGSFGTILNNAAPIRDAEGRIIGGVVVAQDITDRKRMEDELRESEERFRALADNIAQMAWMADKERGIFWYNKRWYDYTGAAFEEMKGWGWRKICHPDYVIDVVKTIKNSLESGEDWEETFPIRGRDGNYRWFLTRAVTIKDEEGRVVRWFGTGTDITEITELRQSLEWAREEAERESYRSSVLEGIAEAGIATLDLQELLDTLAERIAKGLGAQSGHILLLDDKTDDLVTRATYNVPPGTFRIPKAEGFVGKVLTEGRTVYLADAENDPLFVDERIKREGIKSLLGTPLMARNRVLGVVYVNFTEIREFTEYEAGLLEAVAVRASQGIENTRLYEEVVRSRRETQEALNRELEFSRLLQRALLPEKPVISEGYAVADVYVPAFAGREIGGDFYDVFTTAHRKVGVLIGDVSGKGLESASLAADTRSTVRAFAYDLSSAGKALTHSNAVLFAQQMKFGMFVTVLLLIIDPETGTLSYSSAGHTPAAIYHVDGSVEFLTFGQPPVGVLAEQEYEEAQSCLNPGEKIAMYTDGISEARRGPEFFGTEGVERILKEFGHYNADELVGELLAAASGWADGDLHDDAAIIIVERESGT